ncbi:uncharacterized protein B0P05DRAFT_528717 [Gilbertella persicaria]|uniref:uncharacterized protein n=1 Tax=Gilbertella persicaria TaxID=101096 RepID=UPI00221EA896|nr:uncharacterized protein B0P05DRAFT_528717 [Gilbertella persicaria]KAI8091087.1 hypothetical protein B0P05DRAFT_528717 [Gilbertella persicaria]
MADNVCFSLLKTATQQIIQSAGFEAANNRSIDTLADVFGKYIELLGSTVSAYASLNGRTMGTARDVFEALNEVAIDPNTLKMWLEEEGKALSPCWSAQSDPGRLLQGVIAGGRNTFEDIIEYRFGHVQAFDLSEDEQDTDMLLDSPIQENALPDYVPSYFPAFPEIKEDTVMEEATQLLLEKQQREQQQLQLQQKQELPLPVIVKHRKKPIENPFTHIIPFDESNLASAKEKSRDEKPLSMSVELSTKPTEPTNDRKTNIEPLMEALKNIQSPNYKLGEGLEPHEEEALFKTQTQDAAAPGNYMFNRDNGVFDEIVLHSAEPLISSKITTPNLSFDVAIATAPATPTTDYIPGSPDHKLMSRSMLAALAKKGKQFGKLRPGMSNPHAISKHSVDINAIKTGESKYLMKKKRMLAEQQAMEERQRLLEQQLKENPNATIEQLTPVQSLPLPLPPPPPPSSSAAAPPLSSSAPPLPPPLPLSQPTLLPPAPPPVSKPVQPPPPLPVSKPINTGPISLSSFSQTEKKHKKPTTPKLTLNFPLPPPPPPPQKEEDNQSPSTPKIRFKIKPPMESPLVKKETPVPTYSEEINCICENPTVDYGTFMIACDGCGVWFHGSCVGIAESDQVEEWYCKRCR